MNDHAADSLANVRLKRAYRHAAALACQSAQEAPSWEELDALPHWCLLDDSALQTLQSIAGAVFLAPALRRCIDGVVLTEVRGLIGDLAFSQVLSLSASDKVQLSDKELPAISAEVVCSSGATVLLSTLPSTSLRQLFEPRLAVAAGELSQPMAQMFYVRAADIHRQVSAESAATEPSGSSS